MLLSSSLVFPVQASPAAILKVSLPAGAIFGPNPDPWLNEGWLLNLTGAVQTFTVRINNTSSSKRSYDTRLVIALNDAGYNNLVSLVVNGTAVPKSAFRYGRPKPYKLWSWPDDVYSTWFNDTCINVGTITRTGFKNLIVSVIFSSATGVRMHFDAWGRTTSYLPCSIGDITHNSNSKDSTVLLYQGLPSSPKPPIAAFFFEPSYPTSGDTVTFNATASYDPDGYIVTYRWDFGDATSPVTEYDPIITHIYSKYGDYHVTLTVTDNSSLTDSAQDIVSVRQRPVASFDFCPPDPLEHEFVVFDASSSTPDGGVLVSYEWDFGDGTPHVVESDPVTNHTYDTYGTYILILNVTDSEGKWDIESKPITVERCPIADFYWTPYWPQQGETVTFNASFSTPDGGVIVYYEWDFGDGSPHVLEFDPIINHTYSSHGTYTVTLNVTDSECRSGIKSDYISVRANPCASFTWSPPSPLRGQTVTFDGSSSTPDGGTLVSYTWDFGDGAPPITESDPITSHVYASSGNFTVTLNITDSEEKWDIESKQVSVGIPKYYLTVKTDPISIIEIPGEGWYDECTSVNLTAPIYVPISTTVRYRFDYWDVDSVSQGSGINEISVHMDASHTATAHFILQYKVIFNQTGLSSDANGIVVTVDSEPQTYVDLPFHKWVDTGTKVYYSYESTVSSSISGKRYRRNSVTGPSSPITVTSSVTVAGKYVIQYQVTFGQTGVGTDFTGIVVTVDLTGYDRNGATFWWDNGTVHSFTFASPLVVNPSKEYYWVYTSGLSTLKSETLTITTSGSVMGNYASLDRYQITFGQTNVGPDFSGTIVVIDGTNYNVLPQSFLWDTGSNHTFSFQSQLIVTPNIKQYVWTSTTGLSSSKNGFIIVSTSGSVTGNYKTQYMATFAKTGLSSDAAGTVVTVDGSPKTYGVLPYSKWVDSGSQVNYLYGPTVSSSTPGRRYRLNSVTGPTSPIPITSAVTVTGNFVTQYSVTSAQTGLDSTASGTIVTVNGGGKTFGDLPYPLWVDNGSSVSYSYGSLISSNTAGKRFKLTNTVGPTSPITATSSVTVTLNYKIQYELKVPTTPQGLSPEPTRNPPGEPGSWWYDSSTDVLLTAPQVTGYTFQYWDVDGTSRGNGVNPITVTMSASHTATAHYQVVSPQSPPSAVGGYATLIDTAPSSVPITDFARVLTAMIIAAAFIISATMTKHKIAEVRKKP